ncbi:MAG: heavy-metal-associated domain-containing protein [Nanoarchaeota archaeon]
MKKMNLNIKGMHCKSCEVLISDALAEVGVKSHADTKKGTATIEFDESKITLEKVKSIIAKEGYKVV